MCVNLYIRLMDFKGAFLIHLSRKVPAATETLILKLCNCRIHVETLSQKTLQV